MIRHDPFSQHITKVIAHNAGIIIGRTELPLVNEGDAIFHLAIFEDSKAVLASVESFEDFVDESIDGQLD